MKTVKLVKKNKNTNMVPVLLVSPINTLGLAIKQSLETEDYMVFIDFKLDRMVATLKSHPNILSIIVDLDIPGLNIPEILVAIRTVTRSVKIIALLGDYNLIKVVEVMRYGFDSLITKPIDFLKLHAVLKRESSLARLKGQDISVDEIKFKEIIFESQFSQVFKVEYEGERRALKIFKPNAELVTEHLETFEKRFFQEASILTTIHHPNLVAAFCYGRLLPKQSPYIMLEFLSGKMLSEVIDDISLHDFKTKICILCQIARGLLHLHQKGILHRDIKPQNIIVDTSFHAKLIDFGIAKCPEGTMTATGEIFGTPLYMAPEAFISAKTDKKADMFSFGVIAYEFLTGYNPFVGKSLGDVMGKVQHFQPPDPENFVENFPLCLKVLLNKLLEKDPSRRFSDLCDLIIRFDRFIGDPASCKMPIQTKGLRVSVWNKAAK